MYVVFILTTFLCWGVARLAKTIIISSVYVCEFIGWSVGRPADLFWPGYMLGRSVVWMMMRKVAVIFSSSRNTLLATTTTWIATILCKQTRKKARLSYHIDEQEQQLLPTVWVLVHNTPHSTKILLFPFLYVQEWSCCPSLTLLLLLLFLIWWWLLLRYGWCLVMVLLLLLSLCVWSNARHHTPSTTTKNIHQQTTLIKFCCAIKRGREQHTTQTNTTRVWSSSIHKKNSKFKSSLLTRHELLMFSFSRTTHTIHTHVSSCILLFSVFPFYAMG